MKPKLTAVNFIISGRKMYAQATLVTEEGNLFFVNTLAQLTFNDTTSERWENDRKILLRKELENYLTLLNVDISDIHNITKYD